MVRLLLSLLSALLVFSQLSGCESGDFSASATSTLATLSVSDGTLSPRFSGNHKRYTLTVKESTKTLTLTAVPAHDLATITINGQQATAGTKSAPLPIGQTPFTILVKVTSPDESRSSEYQLTVLRPNDPIPEDATTDPAPQPSGTAKPAQLSSIAVENGPLVQTFNPASLRYDANVSYLTGTASITAKPADPKAAVSVNGIPLKAPDYRAEVPLKEGSNTVNIVVTAADTGSKETYQLSIRRASANAFVQGSILHAKTGQKGARFGFSIASSGNIAAVGAPHASTAGKNEAGLVYIFRLIDGNWVQIQQLTEPSPQTGNWFGYQLAMQDDTLFIGTFGHDGEKRDSGKVYLYQAGKGQSWTLKSSLQSPEPRFRERFGYNIAVSGDHLAIATLRGPDAIDTGGDIYLYHRNNGGWEHLQTIGIAGSSDRYGQSIALDDDLLAIGSFAPDDECRRYIPDPGSVTLYRLTGEHWKKEATLKADNAGGGDRFGFTLSLSNGTLAAGAICEDSNEHSNNDEGTEVGAVYVFTQENGEWQQQAYIKEQIPRNHNLFGSRVELDSGLLVISAALSDIGGEDTGIVYLYQGSGADWKVIRTLQPDDVTAFDEFGFDMALNDGNLLIGSTQPRQNQPTSTGKVYTYR